MFLSLVLILFVCLQCNFNCQNIYLGDLNTLESVYNSTNGDNWDLHPGSGIGVAWNFTAAYLNPSIPCNTNKSIGWYGLHCNSDCGTNSAEECRVVNLILEEMQIYGSLPCVLSTLTNLTNLNMMKNSLYGTICDGFGSLASLQRLFLAENMLSGTIPSTFGNLSIMIELNVTQNYLHGTLPLSMFTGIPNMEILYISHNYFSGDFPSGIVVWNESLLMFDIASCGFDSSIPSWIGGLSRLQILNVEFNSLTGTVPDGLWTIGTLLGLDLEGNYFVGSISSSISQLSSMQVLNLAENQFTGVVLPYFASDVGSYMPDLFVLDLSDNRFEGSLPLAFGSIESMRFLYIYGNHFTGSISDNLLAYSDITQIIVSSNQFTGTLPNALAQVTTLEILDFFGNRFTGGIPSTYNLFPTLASIDLGGNFLSGTIPSDMGSLTSLDFLGLDDNRFTGSIPGGLGELSALATFIVKENLLSGFEYDSFTADILQNLSLEVFDFSVNIFRGQIPDTLFLLPKLRVLSASGNCFGGTVPSTICMATSLEVLSLNGLSSGSTCALPILFPVSYGVYYTSLFDDSIPSCLMTELPNLEVLQLSGNGFRGVLPDFVAPRLANFSVSHNRIGGTIPMAIRKHSLFKHLDLSYNKLAGTCKDMNNYTLSDTMSDDDAGGGGGGGDEQEPMALSLKVNRLSGFIQLAFRQAALIDVLTGNYFYCFNPASQLPENDPAYEEYSCGSSVLESSFNLTTLITIVGIIIAMVISQWGATTGLKQTCSASFEHLKMIFRHDWVSSDITSLETRAMLLLFYEIRRLIGKLLSFVIVVCLSTYLLVSSSSHYSTTEYQYGWYLSPAFTSGYLPAVVYFLLWSAFLYYCYYHFYNVQRHMCVFYEAGVSPKAPGCVSDTTAEAVSTEPSIAVTPSAENTIEYKVDSEMSSIERSASSDSVSRNIRRVSSEVMSEVISPLVGSIGSISSVLHDKMKGTLGNLKEEYSEKFLQNKTTWKEAFYLYFLVQLVNGIVVLSVNGIYVYLIITQDTVIRLCAQIVLVAFKTIWNARTVPWLVKQVCYVEEPIPQEEDPEADPQSMSNAAAQTVTQSATVASSVSRTSTTGRSRRHSMHEVDEDTIGPEATLVRHTIVAMDDNGAVETRTVCQAGMRHYQVQVLLLVFNNVIAPYLATAAADSNCFLQVFVPPAEVDTVYVYPHCYFLGSFDSGHCDQLVYTEVQNSYIPPFIYYYQCSTSVLTNYVPVFVFLYTFLGIVIPFLHYVGFYNPAYFGSSHSFAQTELFIKILDRKKYGVYRSRNATCSLVGHLAVFLTFGVVYPPLACMVALYVFTTTVSWQNLMYNMLHIIPKRLDAQIAAGGGAGATVSQLREQKERVHDSLATLEYLCIDLWKVLHHSRYVVLSTTALFYATFLFDMVGDVASDADPLVNMIWVPILMIVLSVYIGTNKVKLFRSLQKHWWTMVSKCRLWFSMEETQTTVDRGNGPHELSIDGIELSGN